MKLRYLLIAILIISGIAFLVFKLNETFIIQKLTPFFPSKDENTPGYYADLISFIFSESLWLIVLLVATLYFTFYGNLHNRINELEVSLLRNTKRTLYIVLLVFFFITVLIATVGLEQFPNSADEFAYLFQAEQFSEGKLWTDVHPLPSFFEFHHLAQKDDKWLSRFPPGWSLVLSIAYTAHVPPFLINALLAVLALWVFFKLINRLYDERMAMWSLIFLAFSSFYLFNAATYFSHILSFLEGLLFIYFAHRYLQSEKIVFAFLAGIFLGMLAMTRQLNALIFFLPVCAYVFSKLKFRAIIPLFFIGLGALPFIGFFLWYNFKITGDPFIPVTMWTNADEALGFVKGHTPMKGIKFTFKRFMMFIYFASPSLLILYFLYLFERLKNYKKIFLHPEDYIFVLLVAGYFFYYHSGGNQYGPRFYFEGFPFLVGFVVVKVLRSNIRWAKVFLFCGLIFSVLKIPFVTYREHIVVQERKDVYTLVKENSITNAVVFISSETGIIRPMPVENLNRNDRYYRNDVIYARDLGEDNIKLMEFYGSRDFYKYERSVDAPSGKLIKLP